ncbi:MAG: DUF1501 domain-containing protein [Nostocoides sp.]
MTTGTTREAVVLVGPRLTLHHDNGDDTLLVDVDGTPTPMCPDDADSYVEARFGLPDLTEVEHVDGGPRGVRRRHILSGTSASIGGLLTASFMPRYSFSGTTAQTTAAGATKPLLICVFMRGGYDGLSGIVPVNDSNYYKARPGIGVPQEETVSLDSTWGMNKNLSGFQSLWKAGQLAVLQGCGSPDLVRSHFEDQATVERAAPATMRSGWLGRHLQTVSSSGTFRGVTLGNSAALSLTTNALETLAVSSIDAFDLRTEGTAAVQTNVSRIIDEMYLGAGGALQEQAKVIFGAIDTLKQLRGMNTTPANGASYPTGTWGTGLSEVARLSRLGLGMEVAAIDYGNWDMHGGVGKAANPQDWFSKQAREFSTGLEALRVDLGDQWDNTIVVTMSEFGRRVLENGSGGLDHGHGNTMFIMGGGVKGGVYGQIPSLAPANLVEGDVPITLDYRQALWEIVGKHLGNSHVDQVFPGFAPGTDLGVV